MLRLRKLFLISLLAFPLSSCKQGPKVTVCVSDPQANGFECYDQRTQKNFHLAYADSDKYVAMPPADAQTIFNFCAQKTREAAQLE